MQRRGVLSENQPSSVSTYPLCVCDRLRIWIVLFAMQFSAPQWHTSTVSSLSGTLNHDGSVYPVDAQRIIELLGGDCQARCKMGWLTSKLATSSCFVRPCARRRPFRPMKGEKSFIAEGVLIAKHFSKLFFSFGNDSDCTK